MIITRFLLTAFLLRVAAAIPTSVGVDTHEPTFGGHGLRVADLLSKHIADGGSARPYDPEEAAFGGACTDVTIEHGGTGEGDSTLRGICRDGEGRRWETGVNLNRCIVNVKGQLQFFDNPGLFDDSCADCGLFRTDTSEGLYFACACIDELRGVHGSFLEFGGQVLDELAVKPVEGQLVCGTNKGTKEEPNSGLVKQVVR